MPLALLPCLLLNLKTAANEEKIIRISRERYSNSKADVEEKIRRWTGMLSEEEKAALRKSIAEPATTKTVAQQAPPKKTKAREEAKPILKKNVNPEKERETKVEEKNLPSEISEQEEHSAPTVSKKLKTTKLPDSVPQVIAEDSEERPLFEALCATCEKLIQVPFQPDGSRPTFCKDCLKDYQRAVARERMSLEDKAGEKEALGKTKKTSQGKARVYTGKEQPMKLGQMQHVTPKKFKPLREKNEAQLNELRSLVQSIRPINTES